MTLQSYHYRFIERLWLRIESRSLDKRTHHIIMIIPVLLFMQKERLEIMLDTLPQVLERYVKPHLVQRVFAHIIIKLKGYVKDEQLFLEERLEAFECIANDIQLYALVLDLFENEDEQEVIAQIVRKKFDKDYQLDKENMRLLIYQEKHCLQKQYIAAKKPVAKH